MLGMQSSQGEHVAFRKGVETLEQDEEGEISVRRIENWLIDTEVEMKMSLRWHFWEAGKEQEQQKRSEWLFDWPA